MSLPFSHLPPPLFCGVYYAKVNAVVSGRESSAAARRRLLKLNRDPISVPTWVKEADLVGELIVKILPNVHDALPLQAAPNVHKLFTRSTSQRVAGSSGRVGMHPAPHKNVVRKWVRKAAVPYGEGSYLVSLLPGCLVWNTRHSSSHTQCAQGRPCAP